MTTTYTTSQSSVLPGQVTGQPVTRIPWAFLCCQGERFCGWTAVANSWRQVPEMMTAKREHEENCAGGFILGAVS